MACDWVSCLGFSLHSVPYSLRNGFSGVLFEITRQDGLPFDATTLNVRYHNNPVESLWNRL